MELPITGLSAVIGARSIDPWIIESIESPPPPPKKKTISIICEAKNLFTVISKRHREFNSLKTHKQQDDNVHNLNLEEFNMLWTHHEKTELKKVDVEFL
jgi:hypothetical protein